MTTATETRKLTILTQNGTSLAVQMPDDQLYLVVAFHDHPSTTEVVWTKQPSNEEYVVRIGKRDHAGLDGCTCPSQKHRGHQRPCKHIAATLALMMHDKI